VAVHVDNKGTANLGSHAIIEGHTALMAMTGASITVNDSILTGVGENSLGARLGAGGIINATNSDISGVGSALAFNYSSGTADQSGRMSISGGTLSSQTGALILGVDAANTNNVQSEIILKDGVIGKSNIGVLFNGDEVTTDGSSLSLVIEGATTKIDGVLIDSSNLVTTLTVKNSATWSSTGSSKMDNLVLDNANVEFNMTSTTDRITTESLRLTGDNSVLVGLTNDFLQEVVDLGLPQDFDVGIVKAFQDGDGNIFYTLATSNEQGSTWDIEDLGNGWFRISNVNIVIPEASAYAAILGAIALAFTTYRRRK
jgi:hypothetical protein